jgi:thiol-disulfide isomerase/thioredoxin
LSLLLLVSCNNEDENTDSEEQLEENFTISGTIDGGGNMMIHLEALTQQGSVKVADGSVDASGKFEVAGNIPGMGIYQLRLGEAQDKVIPLTLCPDDKVKMTTSFADFAVKPNVSGTEWSSVMNQYIEKFTVFMKGQMELNSLRGKASEEEIMKLYLELRKPMDAFALQKMKEDPDNPFNIVLSSSATPNMGFKDWNPENLEVLKIVAEAYKKRYKDSPMASTMENQVFQIESAYNEFKASESGASGTNAGTAPDISMATPAGKNLKLSSLRGKVVLIDFWASWCGPCRRESPNVVRLYNQYKDKGFTVFSVSLDQDAAAWKQAIEKDGLVWPNHVSDLLGWNTPMTQIYGFNSIPHTVLIDKQGKIIDTGLRGESLEQKLKEIFSK